MNKGQAFTPLNETASGGEISRLMLAIKTITMSKTDINTLVFDEIDTGVSGKVADAIGQKMHSIALNNQVLCITHYHRWLFMLIIIMQSRNKHRMKRLIHHLQY